MGFRDYSPVLNRFLTLDSYNGALNDLTLSTSPWTSNRYSLAGGNPITGIEVDGHQAESGGGGSITTYPGWEDVAPQVGQDTSGSSGGDSGNPLTNFVKDSWDSITGIPGGVKDMFLGTAKGLSTTSSTMPPQTKSMISDEALEVQGRGLQATADGMLTALTLFPIGGGAGAGARAGAGGLRRLLVSPLRRVGAANAGSRLAEASSSAFRAADNVGDFAVSAKHLPGAGGRWNKWAEGVDINGTIASALRSDGAAFLPNAGGAADSFIVRTNVGSVIGTKGQTFVKAVISNDGRIITAYPVK